MSIPTAGAAAPAPRARAWMLLGVIVGYAGLAMSHATSRVLSTRDWPVEAVADMVIRMTPGAVVEWAIKTLKSLDKPLLIIGIGLVMTLMFAGIGLLARRSMGQAMAGFTVVAAIGFAAVFTRSGFGFGELWPLIAGFVTWSLLLVWLRGALLVAPYGDASGDPDPQPPAGGSRRDFLRRAGIVVGGSIVVTVAGRWLGGARRSVEEARRLLRLDGVTAPSIPERVKVAADGVTPWETPVDDFYLIHTNYSLPLVHPNDWVLRIHGMVDQELTYTYSDLVNRQLTESWITLNCVSNPVGGDLIGNAWWSGVRVADLLAEVGVHAEADCVLQTSETGWTCGTPLEALTDDRNAMLAVAQNGEPLTIEHGFPVRTIVPGLYGYVSACKWVVDYEVTRFADVTAYWTDRGWSELGPVKLASRIDVPVNGDELEAGEHTFAGVAWQQHTGISGVQVSLDGGKWLDATLAGWARPKRPNLDTWVQWKITLDLTPGDHQLQVRAIDVDGNVQTGELAEPVPDGATGWHTVDFSVE